jgi:hypothetical protein
VAFSAGDDDVPAVLLASAMGNTVTANELGRDCGAAEIQRIPENVRGGLT